ncbi:DNA-binding response regulator, partial [Nonomuraea sp. NPDC049784]
MSGGDRHVAGGGRVIRVVLADDEPLIRSGWATMLSLYDDIEVAGEAADGRAAVELGREAD